MHFECSFDLEVCFPALAVVAFGMREFTTRAGIAGAMSVETVSVALSDPNTLR
jgi:hypothetical protein